MSGNQLYATRLLNTAQYVRLLTIINTQVGISCILTSHKLEAGLRYTAVSYTWGDPFSSISTLRMNGAAQSNPARFIKINDVDFHVTENLFDALSSFIVLENYGPFWIDAICINQEDDIEKAAQVAMMGDIYACAIEVIAWLGPSSMTDSGALQLHNSFIPDLRAQLGHSFSNPATLKVLDLNHLNEMGFLQDHQILRSYPAFRHRAWFLRAWIFQEALLSSNLRFLYATTFIERRNIDDMAIFDANSHPSIWAAMGQNPIPYTSLRTLQMLRDVFELNTPGEAGFKRENLSDRESIKDAVQRSKGIWYPLITTAAPSSILNANTIRTRYTLLFVNILRYRHCTDLRDKVYASVGAINRLIPPKCRADVFKVRYENATVEDVYINFATWVLNRDPQMTILSYIEDPSERRLHGLPSWVPDLSVATEILELIGQRSTLEDCEGISAAPYLLTRTVSGRKLFTLADCLGEVVAVDSVPLTDQLSSTSCSIRGFLSFCDGMEHQYFNRQDRIEAVWRTLIVDRDFSGESRMPGQFAPPVGSEMTANFRSYITLKLARTLLNTAKGWPSEPVSVVQPVNDSSSTSLNLFMDEHSQLLDRLAGPAFPSTSEFAGHLSSHLKTLEHHASRYARCLQIQGRRLYRTDKGHIGLAPRSTSVGDKIYTFQAARLPFMLRPNGVCDGKPSFSVIGEAYLHGRMEHVEKAMDSGPDFSSSQIVIV